MRQLKYIHLQTASGDSEDYEHPIVDLDCFWCGHGGDGSGLYYYRPVPSGFMRRPFGDRFNR